MEVLKHVREALRMESVPRGQCAVMQIANGPEIE